MSFKVGVTRDLMTEGGGPCFAPAAFDELAKAGIPIAWEWLPETLVAITPEIAAAYDGLHVNLPRVTQAGVARADCRVRIIARNGVGYDSVDVPAMTARGILVTNTPVAVRRPVAVATLTLLFALAGRLFAKDRLVRTGRWDDRVEHMGLGLTGRTLGLLGAGSIGQEVARLASPFFGRVIAADPYVSDATVAATGATRVPFDTLLAESDFLVACCLLTPETRHLMNAAAFARMRRSAFFVNVGRGPIHDEAALAAALRAGQIAGAGLDVTEVEPIPADSPLIGMDQVILTPHALCWTDECFEDIARTALRSIADVAAGRRPAHLVDPAAWDQRRPA
jgi:phosphoglycerate dehydrogenase-like enzyme